MKQTTAIMKKPITLEGLKRVIEIEKQISKALELFGYDLEKHKVTIKPSAFHRYVLYMDGQYFGVWACDRRMFVD